MPEWNADPDGTVPFQPLADFTVGTPAGGAVALRLDVMLDAAALQDGRRGIVQTIMTPSQARELAETLLRAVASTHEQPPPESA